MMRLVLLRKAAHRLHYRTVFRGLPISIENRRGSRRYWYDPLKDEDGSTKMRCPYGYIRLTHGADGDHLDCYLGPNKESDSVFIIRQVDPMTGRYDEDKVMLGFDTELDAQKAYLAHYDDPAFFGGIMPMTFNEFTRLLDEERSSARTRLTFRVTERVRGVRE